MENELSTPSPGASEFTSGFSGVTVARSLVFCVIFCDRRLSLLFFCHCFICPPTCGFWLHLWYLQLFLSIYHKYYVFHLEAKTQSFTYMCITSLPIPNIYNLSLHFCMYTMAVPLILLLIFLYFPSSVSIKSQTSLSKFYRTWYSLNSYTCTLYLCQV